MRKILILEDEPRAANQLQRVLKDCDFSYELLGIVDSVEDAVHYFKNNESPDLVFMDIQLADGLSFEIFLTVNMECPIIFTTAFDQYAIKAFKFNSVDYLLKPIKQEDLQVSLNKFNRSQNPAPIGQEAITSFLQLLSSQKKESREGILVKEGSGFVQIRISDILYFYSADSITFAVTKNKRYLVDETLDQLLQTVDEDMFFRINRGQAVQKTSVHRLNPHHNHRIKLLIENGADHEFIVSRQRTADFKKWMNR